MVCILFWNFIKPQPIFLHFLSAGWPVCLWGSALGPLCRSVDMLQLLWTAAANAGPCLSKYNAKKQRPQLCILNAVLGSRSWQIGISPLNTQSILLTVYFRINSLRSIVTNSSPKVRGQDTRLTREAAGWHWGLLLLMRWDRLGLSK